MEMKTAKEMKANKQMLELKREVKAMKGVNKDWFDKVLRLDKKNEMRPKSARGSRVIRRPRNIRFASDSQIQMPQE
jgi:serine/threonine-protein phosphatase 2B catalytic subunit